MPGPRGLSPSRRRPATILLGVALSAALSGCGALAATDDVVVVTNTVTTVTAPGGPPAQGGVDGGPTIELGGEGPAAPPAPDGAPVPAPRADGGLESVVGASAGFTGIAVTAVGGRDPVESAGTWTSGVAWSTIKVPLAVAVARTAPQALAIASSAITSSDNDAAETLWASLGGGDAAASAVGAVLADGGDTTSQVPSVRTRAGYSIFGQTNWALADQARFGSRLPCLASSEPVLGLMGQISPDQQWGLGRIPGVRFKGGWGPGESGGYLVRQFGIVPAAGGDVAVAIATDAPSFEAGIATLSGVADALAPRLASMRGGEC